MLTKVIFTIAVVVGVLFLARLRRRPGVGQARPTVAAAQSQRTLIHWLAAAVVILMIAGAAVYIYLDWRDAHEIVQIRVVESGSGNSSEYQAYRGEIENRSFRTTDGRRVVLAATERMETSGR